MCVNKVRSKVYKVNLPSCITNILIYYYIFVLHNSIPLYSLPDQYEHRISDIKCTDKIINARSILL